ncbi:MAG: hypothetical protein A3G27_05975 [Betaproteobacteria bacterium RIFCSPLOWO2_12_FULL_66_14]|nr:MAG: hypothetical protein A3G27_05975 [Betaproteobacteria bacterium RIFCSPLOWO2_12_FULL_66_14]
MTTPIIPTKAHSQRLVDAVRGMPRGIPGGATAATPYERNMATIDEARRLRDAPPDAFKRASRRLAEALGVRTASGNRAHTERLLSAVGAPRTLVG